MAFPSHKSHHKKLGLLSKSNGRFCFFLVFFAFFVFFLFFLFVFGLTAVIQDQQPKDGMSSSSLEISGAAVIQDQQSKDGMSSSSLEISGTAVMQD